MEARARDDSWVASLDNFLRGADRVLLLGIGNPVRGDDGAGTRVAEIVTRSLQKFNQTVPCLAIPGGSAPENYTGAIRRFGPARTILVDAVSAGLPAGSVTIIDPGLLGGITLSTHTMPLGILRDYLMKEGFSDQTVIGIQPQGIRFGEPMSEPVRKATRSVAKAILKCLS